MIKDSIKSLEGKGFVGIIASCVGVLYMIVTGSPDIPPIPIEEILKHAQSATEIAEAYSQDAYNISEAVGMGKMSVLLFFMYKLYDKFIGKRNILKLKELELKEIELNTKVQ